VQTQDFGQIAPNLHIASENELVGGAWTEDASALTAEASASCRSCVTTCRDCISNVDDELLETRSGQRLGILRPRAANQFVLACDMQIGCDLPEILSLHAPLSYSRTQ